MSNKHTDGPWTITPCETLETIDAAYRVDINGEHWGGLASVVVATVWFGDEPPTPSKQGIANARVIAAAPTMYAFIKDIAHFDDNCTCDRVSWHGPGHASECLQEQAGAIIRGIQS